MSLPRVQNTGTTPTGRGSAGIDSGAAAPEAGFRQQLLTARLGFVNQALDKHLAQIEQLGARLAVGGNLEDLHSYRNAIQGFFREVTVQGYQVRQEMDWDHQSWEQRTMVVLEKVNKELDELAEMVHQKEKGRLGVLEKTGLILGMLLDIRL